MFATRFVRFGTALSAESQGLYWSMAAVAVAALLHAEPLPWWVIALTMATASWRVVIETRAWRLPPGWLRILIAVGAMVGVAFTFRTLNGLEAGTALLVAMAGIKLLETKGARDCTMVIFIGFVLLFSALLYDQSLLRLPYILVSTWVLVAALLRLHESAGTLRVRDALRRTGAIGLQALPVAVLFFIFFPRLPGQFWALPTRTNAATGLNDEMTLGEVSNLTRNGAVAFRVSFDDAVPPAAERYWRGPVLHDFDGRRWSRDSSQIYQRSPIETSGQTYRYRLTLEPTQRPWLYALDVPTQWPIEQAGLAYDFQLSARQPITTLTAFVLESRTQFRSTTKLPRAQRELDVRLPGAANPRARALAIDMRARAGSDSAYVDAVLAKFRREQFYYTLTPPLLGENPIDEFLFSTRRGFCEHFAAAFTTLMRAADIPARVITGYQGGEYNSLGEYLIVRQSDAHAWTEVWLEDRGWVRVDPTAAVAPERIEKNLDAAISDEESVPGRFLRMNFLFGRAQLTWDAINNFWNNRVVQYDSLKQRALLAFLGLDATDWRQLGIVFAAVLVTFFLALTAYLAWQYRPRNYDPVVAAYDRLCGKLARVGVIRELYEGPVDFLKRAASARPTVSPTLNEACALYTKLRYGPSSQAADLRRLKLVVRQLSL